MSFKGKEKPVLVPSNSTLERNPGVAFQAELFNAIKINKSAVERRVGTFAKRRTVKKDHQAAWLLKAITCIDLTTLSGDDTDSNVKRLCAKAKQPVRRDILEKLGATSLDIHTGAICVYHNYVATAARSLDGSAVELAAVSTGFPAGLIPMAFRLNEIRESVKDGASEIDIVISRHLVLNGDWQGLYDEVKAFRQACGDAHLKAILATGELGTLTNVAKASWVCMMAGADFIKTSTGKESVNATLEVSLVMLRAIREYYQLTGYKVGYKPAGGIQKAKQAIEWLVLIKEELGTEWLTPELFRFGASSLLGDIERQLEHCATGRYSATHRHPMA